MYDLDMVLNDLWMWCPGMMEVEVKKYFDHAPLDTIEVFRDCSPDIALVEGMSKEMWDYIQKELKWNIPGKNINIIE
jgi:hypothetical protein